MHRSRACFTAALAATAGCAGGPEGSERIPLADIYADFEVRANGTSSSRAQASLRIDSSTYLQLTGSDRLIAAAADAEHEMTGSEFLGIVTYNATFQTSEAGTLYTIAFERGSGSSAPGSRAELPPPFDLDAPTAGETFSRSEDAIELSYSPSGSGDRMRWTVTGGCVEYEESDVQEDDGVIEIGAGDIEAIADFGAGCTVTLRAERVRDGAVDPAFGEGGAMRAIQVRAIDVELVP